MSSGNKFYRKQWLENVKRIHPPLNTQRVDNKLRLHRAERLHPFSPDFFKEVIDSFTEQQIRCYPDVNKLKSKLLLHLCDKYLTVNNILINNGSSEIIRNFYDAFAINGEKVLLTEYCYPMHRVYAELHNCQPTYVKYKLNEETNKSYISYRDIVEKINNSAVHGKICCVVIANPNSPVGDSIEIENLEYVIQVCNKKSIPILIDEAYIDFSNVDSCMGLIHKYENLVVSRTFSKAYGSAGMRIGYAVGQNSVMEIVNKFVPTYEISAFSVHFACCLLDRYFDEVEVYIDCIIQEIDLLDDICYDNKIDSDIREINTVHIRPKNIKLLTAYMDKEQIHYRMRKLPLDDNEYLAIVLFPGFTTGKLMEKILYYHNGTFSLNENINHYRKNGYWIEREVLNEDVCSDIVEQLDDVKTDMKIPHTDIQFGYGNLVNHKLSQYITNNQKIIDFCREIYGGSYHYNSLYIHNKHKWIGPDIEWHQEVYNIKTFHPSIKLFEFDMAHCNDNPDFLDYIRDNFMQVYVALEDQTLENGCIKMIPYHDSVLDYYDTTNIHLNHKRAIKPAELDRVYKSHGIINLELKAGDVVFFNHLIPHSSSSNNGPNNRKAMVFLTYKDDTLFNEEIRTTEKEYRKKFAMNYLETELEKKRITEIYECGKEKKDMDSNRTWKDIFEELPWYKDEIVEDEIKNYDVETLLKINGHSVSPTGGYTMETWNNTVNHIKEMINYTANKHQYIAEIGCGAGALLKMFTNDYINNKYELCIMGIEPSKKYYSIACKVFIDKCNIINQDALNGLTILNDIDVDVDIILAHSSIQYFPNLKYFEQVLNKCYKCLKNGGKIAFTDLCDKDKETKCIEYRIKTIGKEKYEEKYENTNLKHFYISRNEINELIKGKFKLIGYTDAVKRGDEDDFYRFNFFAEKI